MSGFKRNMSKYVPLWVWLSGLEESACTLSFDEIERLAGVPLDHSFLQYKKELTAFGWQVKKISMKAQTVFFERIAAPREVRRLTAEELPQALELVWEVFCRFEAPAYSPEGTAEFRAILDDAEQIRNLDFFGAFAGAELVGVLAMRPPRHISLFFVRADCHRQGVGRSLFDAMQRYYARPDFTVNAAPYALEFYRHLGFVPTASEQITRGIRYTPMQRQTD